jgi:hypothetical protein
MLTNIHQYSLSWRRIIISIICSKGYNRPRGKSFSQIHCCYRSKNDTRLSTLSLIISCRCQYFTLYRVKWQDNRQHGKDLEGRGRVIDVISCIFIERLRRTTKKLGKRSWLSSRESNQALPNIYLFVPWNWKQQFLRRLVPIYESTPCKIQNTLIFISTSEIT